MSRFQDKFIHLIVMFAIMCATVLDFKIQAVADIDQLTQSINVINSYDDGLSKMGSDDSSQTVNAYFDDPEDSKYALVPSAKAWNLAAGGHGIHAVSLPLAAKSLLINSFLARAPPVLI